MERGFGRDRQDDRAMQAGEDAADMDESAAEGLASEVEPAAVGEDLESLRAANAALEERMLRVAAEFENFRKRTAREWNEQKARATAEVLREMLELADNLERALGAPEEDRDGLRKGVELIAQQLQAKLKRFGVEPIAARGEEFDPNRHEALMLVDSDAVDSQHVVDVVQRGYMLGGEVLRPARVTVAR